MKCGAKIFIFFQLKFEKKKKIQNFYINIKMQLSLFTTIFQRILTIIDSWFMLFENQIIVLLFWHASSSGLFSEYLMWKEKKREEKEPWRDIILYCSLICNYCYQCLYIWLFEIVKCLHKSQNNARSRECECELVNIWGRQKK